MSPIWNQSSQGHWPPTWKFNIEGQLAYLVKPFTTPAEEIAIWSTLSSGKGMAQRCSAKFLHMTSLTPIYTVNSMCSRSDPFVECGLIRSTQSTNSTSQNTVRPTNIAALEYTPQNPLPLTCSQSPDNSKNRCGSVDQQTECTRQRQNTWIRKQATNLSSTDPPQIFWMCT